MSLPKLSIIGGALLGCLLSSIWMGCTTDCIYESYTNSDGQQACARVCPLTDAQGNEVVDENGKTVFEDPEKGEDVHRINCDPFRSVGATTSTTSSGSTSSGTSTTSSGTTSSTSSTGTTDTDGDGIADS